MEERKEQTTDITKSILVYKDNFRVLLETMKYLIICNDKDVWVNFAAGCSSKYIGPVLQY